MGGASCVSAAGCRSSRAPSSSRRSGTSPSPSARLDKQAGSVLEWQQSAADALVTLAQHGGGERGVRRSPTTLIVHLSDDAPPLLEGAGPLSPETAERLTCDARRLTIKPSGRDLVHSRVGRCASYAQHTRAAQTLGPLPVPGLYRRARARSTPPRRRRGRRTDRAREPDPALPPTPQTPARPPHPHQRHRRRAHVHRRSRTRDHHQPTTRTTPLTRGVSRGVAVVRLVRRLPFSLRGDQRPQNATTDGAEHRNGRPPPDLAVRTGDDGDDDHQENTGGRAKQGSEHRWRTKLAHGTTLAALPPRQRWNWRSLRNRQRGYA